MDSSGGGVWDTQPNDTFWLLGAAGTLDTALYNASDGTVNFAVAAGNSFKIVAADWQNRMLPTGSTFTLKATFADASTASANVLLK